MNPSPVTGNSSQVVTRPSGGFGEAQRHVSSLGMGSPARRTYFQTLYAHYGGGVLDSVTFEEMLGFSKYPDMETSFVKNLRDAIKAKHRTPNEDIGAMPPPWLLGGNLYHALITRDRFDHALKPSILVPPMYHLTAPLPVRLGTFGVEVAKATIESYMELRFEGHRTDTLDGFQYCFFDIKNKERKEDLSPQWISLVQANMVDSAALDIALSVLKLGPSFDEDRLHDVPLTGHQLFYVANCYTHCGEGNDTSLCNEPLRRKEAFANAFSCHPHSHMRSDNKCPSF
ncbi:hypothetical protein HPB49_013218 [Dermacentor silvarum]|uniref:Uncharacterized protein n=1 Tax=Dermacentor silvarum TaxID=543639 RepID=A0ACB8DIV2_DERSI|nr:hypothetical protein HPB49_013218 [Dermacentor silvarum]